MIDLLDLLGGEWAELGKPVDEDVPSLDVVTGHPSCSCSRDEKLSATHGCAESGIAPKHWNNLAGVYVDGMGRPASCAYCPSCVSSGRTGLRDPWTGSLVDWDGAPCRMCMGTGYWCHAWYCTGDHAHLTPRPQLQVIEHFGVTFDGRTFVRGERAPYAGLQAKSLAEAVTA